MVPIYCSLSIIFRAENNLFNSNFWKILFNTSTWRAATIIMILQQPLFLYYVKQSLFCRAKVRDNLSRLLFVFVENVEIVPYFGRTEETLLNVIKKQRLL